MENLYCGFNKASLSDTPIAVDEILNNGYTVIRDSVSIDLIDKFLLDYQDLKKTVLDGYKKDLDSEDCIDGKYRRLVNLHLKVPSLRPLFSKNKALTTTDYFFGEPTTLYTSLYFEIGSSQDLHRDTPYFWTNPGYAYFGVWLALEDVDQENGALEVIPGSHKLIDEIDFSGEIGRIELDKQGAINPNSPELWTAYQKRVFEKCEEAGLSKKIVSVKKGETLIWHPQLMHGGSSIINPSKSRNSLVMHVTPKNFMVYSQDKYFDPSLDGLIPSKDRTINYIESDERFIRDQNLWAIAQKIFLPI
jgi:phytanoyl-CoA hydroxylase